MLPKGAPATPAQQVDSGNGSELRRRLRERYQPAVGRRFLCMLEEILKPQISTLAAGNLREFIAERGQLITDYERQADDVVSDPI
eukprot:15427925-Alexandrium_andersonii.AAC.1